MGGGRVLPARAGCPKIAARGRNAMSPPENHVRATIVGSLPKPSWLCGPAEMFAAALEEAELSPRQAQEVLIYL